MPRPTQREVIEELKAASKGIPDWMFTKKDIKYDIKRTKATSR